jgi:hypothetical protein
MAELPTQRDFEDFSAWKGRDVLAPGGERLGTVEQIFLDEATDLPEWVLVRIEDEDAAAFVPLAGATVEERSIRVEHDRERVVAAPRLDAGKTLTIAEVRRLYDHYGLAHSQEESPTVLPEGAVPDAGEPPAEERPRLRKYIGAPMPPAAPPAAAADPAPAASAPPAPIPAPAPRVVPPEGGFQAHEAREQERGGPLALLKRRPAIPVALAAAIAGAIAVLVLRRRR